MNRGSRHDSLSLQTISIYLGDDGSAGEAQCKTPVLPPVRYTYMFTPRYQFMILILNSIYVYPRVETGAASHCTSAACMRRLMAYACMRRRRNSPGTPLLD